MHFRFQLSKKQSLPIAGLALACLAGAIWLVSARRLDPSHPPRPFRIGFQQSPPHHYIAPDGSPRGPAVDVIQEAARRQHIPLEWVATPEGPEAGIQSGKVDLWPVVGDVPGRRSLMYISDPWLTLTFWMVSLESSRIFKPSDADGKLVLYGSSDLDRRLVKMTFPGSQRLSEESSTKVLDGVCTGKAPVGMISGSMANSMELRALPSCRDARLQFYMLSNGNIPFGVGASKLLPGAARAAAAIRSEIGNMAADGALSSIYFRWYLDPNNEAMIVYYLTQAQRRNDYLTVGLLVMLTLLGLLGLQTRRVRAAQTSAERASLVKSEFLANMSHELRTPMNAVIGMISLVIERCQVPEQKEQLQIAQNAAKSLTSILNDILDLSKIEAGKLVVEAIPFQLRKTVNDALTVFELAAREKRLPLRTVIDPDCPEWVIGDPMRVRQVLLNLVGNAVKFTLVGDVMIRVSEPTLGRTRVEVRDSGIGIPSNKMDAIFEPFTQADGSHTRRFGGNGLGLTITRRLVGLLGGQIWADSVLGQGSCFTFELPLPACPQPVEYTHVAHTTATDLTNLHVLLAEDNVINQKVVSSMLKRYGWTVTVAGNGLEACEKFENEHFDLILMDVQMPELDGIQATGNIRNEERRQGKRAVPIVALTAHASRADHDQCIAGGMDAVVTKPVDSESLRRIISATLDELASREVAARH